MTTHHFQPTHYFNTIGTHPPVLRVADGDTLVVNTIDAHGADEHNQQQASQPNPMSGPFYVEGAEPGDTLVMQIDAIAMNRATGWIRPSLATNVVDPDAVASLPARDPLGEWRIDAEAGTVTLTAPRTQLGAFTLPLKPMIGCFGVAPAIGEAISTATSAQHGGNMDYIGFGPGTTVYFPVAAPGALVFLGDVHAWQGHGEILGTGIETSAVVTFTVRVIKGKRIGWPRGENADYIFTAGNARPLDQCLQHATTEMLAWLQQDYGLDALSANLLLGHVVEYEVGNVFDPAYTMICKVPKQYLPK